MCGIVGIFNEDRPVAPELYFALMALQHRGKESAGIVTQDRQRSYLRVGMGEVPQVFLPGTIESFRGYIGIGQTRYSTTGESTILNAQPIEGKFRGKKLFAAHNGNLVNTSALRKELTYKGLDTELEEECSDTKIIVALLASSPRRDFQDALLDLLPRLQGSFNLIILSQNKLFAVRDRFGFHPLQLGERPQGSVIASESCVFDLLGARFVKDIQPGEFIVADRNGVRSFMWCDQPQLKIDIFEYIYFLRPDSVVHGVEAGEARYWMGRLLADEHPIFDADLIIPVPDSGNEAALGYYERMLENGFTGKFRPWANFRPHTVGRTFIEPVKDLRKKYLRIKFNPRPRQLQGTRVVMVDDSLVRGITEEVVGELLWEAGVKDLYSLKASPPYLHKDIYGIDTYRIAHELIAPDCKGDIERIRKEIICRRGEPSNNLPTYLGYLSLEATIRAVLRAKQKGSDLTTNTFYTGPFTGVYPAGEGDFAKKGGEKR